jgi:hypothetical protein
MWLFFPFAIQGAAMFFDEFYFHHKRRLGLWETIGHPLDSLSVLACYVFLIFNEPNEIHLNIFIGLAVFSCLFVTKDEWVHSEQCDPKENWLHSLLFVLHPVCFLSAAIVWQKQLSLNFLVIQAFLVFCFMTYQALYWGIKWKK